MLTKTGSCASAESYEDKRIQVIALPVQPSLWSEFVRVLEIFLRKVIRKWNNGYQGSFFYGEAIDIVILQCLSD